MLCFWRERALWRRGLQASQAQIFSCFIGSGRNMCYLERVLRYGPTFIRIGAFYLYSRLAITRPKSCREQAWLCRWWRWGLKSPPLSPLLGQPLEGTEAQGLGSLLKKFPQRGHLCRPAARSAFHSQLLFPSLASPETCFFCWYPLNISKQLHTRS